MRCMYHISSCWPLSEAVVRAGLSLPRGQGSAHDEGWWSYRDDGGPHAPLLSGWGLGSKIEEEDQGSGVAGFAMLRSGDLCLGASDCEGLCWSGWEECE